MKMVKEIMRKTSADIEEIEMVFQIIEYFLEGYKGSKSNVISYLEKMKNVMYIDISESDWIEWIRKDIRRWSYVEKALKEHRVENRKALMNISYFLFISDIYDSIIKFLRKIRTKKRVKNNT